MAGIAETPELRVWRPPLFLFALIVATGGVLLSFLIADFAERVRHRVYESRGREAPESSFKQYLAFGLSVFFVLWSAVAYL